MKKVGLICGTNNEWNLFLPVSDPAPYRAEDPVEARKQQEYEANLLGGQAELAQVWLQRWVQERPSVGHNHYDQAGDDDGWNCEEAHYWTGFGPRDEFCKQKTADCVRDCKRQLIFLLNRLSIYNCTVTHTDDLL